MSAINCITRQPASLVQSDGETIALYMDAMREVAAVAAAHGVALGEEVIANNMTLAQSFPPNNKTSMFQDLQAGRRLEIDYLSGAVVRLGREKGIETPIHRTAWVAIKPWHQRTPDYLEQFKLELMVKLLKTQEIASASYLYLRESSAPGTTWVIIERDILEEHFEYLR